MLKNWRVWVSLTGPQERHTLPTPACLFKWWSSQFISQNIVGLLIPALVILLSSYSHTWATGSWWISLCLCLHERCGSPQWNYHLPISALSLDLTDTPERTNLHSTSPMLQGKGERGRPSLSPPPPVSSSAAGRSGAFLAYTHWLHVLNLCQWSGLICSVASHNPNMWSNIFLLDVFHPEAFPVLVKSCNGV